MVCQNENMVTLLGSNYSMCLWLKPDMMKEY